jgi:hypothetical protein
MIGLIRNVLGSVHLVMGPLLQRDPEVYESRVVRRLSKRYILHSLLAKKERDPKKKTEHFATAAAIRASLRHLPVSSHVIDELDLAISLFTFPKDTADGESK